MSAKYLLSCLRREISIPVCGVQLLGVDFLQNRCFGLVMGVFVELMQEDVSLDFVIVLD